MKKMKKILVIIMLINYLSDSNAQNSFGEFIKSFPLYEWNELPEDIRKVKVSDKELDASKLNLYIFSDPYRGEEKPVENNKTRKPPLRMAWDGTFFKGDEGKYNNEYELNLSEDSDTVIYYQIHPLARVQVNDSICMVFLLYNGPGADDNYLGHNLYYEAYTFNFVKEKVLSSITLFKDAKMFFTYIKKGRLMYIYEDYEYITDSDSGDTEQTIARRTYHLRDDGYLQLIDNEFLEGSVAAFTVIDKDGYTNVREQPTTQSPVLYTIKEKLGGILEITDNPNWYKVIYSSNGGERPDKDAQICGWIHKSRVCFDSGRYGWKKGDENVCK